MTTSAVQSAYDRAEFAAIAIARIAVTETDGKGTTAAIEKVVHSTLATDGEVGLIATFVTLARHHSSALEVVASYRGVTSTEVLDSFELHKMAQIADEDDES